MEENNLDILIAKFEEAISKHNPSIVFGTLSPNKIEALNNLSKQRLDFIKQCHPDKYVDSLKEKAEKAFRLFTNLYFIATKRLNEPDTFEVKIGSHIYIVDKNYIDGELSTIHKARIKSYSDFYLLKISKDATVNMLLNEEFRHRNCFNGKNHLISVYEHATINNKSANLINYLNDYITLEDLKNKYIKSGVDGRTLVWIFNRMMAALGRIHDADLVHCAVTPDNFIINKDNHDGVLIDFCYSRVGGSKLNFISHKYKDLYPVASLKNKLAVMNLDIYLAGQTLKYIAGDIPKELSNFLNYLTMENQSRRPNRAFDLILEMKELAQKLYGDPAFHPLVFDAC